MLSSYLKHTNTLVTWCTLHPPPQQLIPNAHQHHMLDSLILTSVTQHTCLASQLRQPISSFIYLHTLLLLTQPLSKSPSLYLAWVFTYTPFTTLTTLTHSHILNHSTHHISIYSVLHLFNVQEGYIYILLLSFFILPISSFITYILSFALPSLLNHFVPHPLFSFILSSISPFHSKLQKKSSLHDQLLSQTYEHVSNLLSSYLKHAILPCNTMHQYLCFLLTKCIIYWRRYNLDLI